MGDGYSYLIWCRKVHWGQSHVSTDLCPALRVTPYKQQVLSNCSFLTSPFPHPHWPVTSGSEHQLQNVIWYQLRGYIYTHAILTFHPQIAFSSWVSQMCYSPKESLIPTAISASLSRSLSASSCFFSFPIWRSWSPLDLKESPVHWS